ncbi:MAG: bifunctional UDP-N-acetylmuramoyl-tripeptide:D-alanyl-D-alanine ligase/alanine racemase [Bacteroidales bacterium]|nr:bifunctional UDP-N-acetylmuramoyl-tripeptide:D-alanyl-D-alanine ligase/alanine racemase [Bacteroidales bacterium]
MQHQYYSLQKISEIVGGQLTGSMTNRQICDLLIDSRQLVVPDQALFFAIVSTRNDGHKYIKELYDKGVRAFVVKRLPEEPCPGASFIQVDDTLRALQTLAAYHRRQFSIPVIGVTGSNGKTIVKEWLFQMLSPDFNIVRSPKSYNSQVGVPLSLWQMSEKNELAVFEAGISESEEMMALQDMIRPTIGVFTNIGQAHDENFINRAQKAGEKLNLFTKAEQLVYCMDYADIQQVVIRSGIASKVKLFTWSRKFEDADLLVSQVVKADKSATVECLYQGERLSFVIPFADDASIENVIQCISVCLMMDYTPSRIAERLRGLTSIAMRLEIKAGVNNCTIINDYYNSDVNSLAIALDVMNQQHQHKRHVVILSDILQSGRSEMDLYAEIGQLLKNKNVDMLIGIGEGISRQSNKFEMERYFYRNVPDFLAHFPFSKFNNQTILLKGARAFEFEQIGMELQEKAHETVLEINFNHLVGNLNHYRSKIKPETKLMVMVKAFGYGSGNLEVSNVLQFHNVDYLTVAFADEGVELRRAGINLPIMVMSPEVNSYDNIIKYHLEPEVFSFRNLEFIERALQNQALPEAHPLNVHIKLDTGMHRLGFSNDELLELIERIKANPMLHVKSVFSHLATADNPAEDAFTLSQIHNFEEGSQKIVEAFPYKVLRHILNTAGITRFTQYQFDMVRLGIGLYGVPTCEADKGALQPVVSLKTTINQIKRIPKGDSIGYNRHGRAEKDMRIGIVPIGYADGLSRLLGNGNGKFYVNGRQVPVVGDICMDMCMLDLSDVEAAEGDTVVIFDTEHDIADIAKACQTIPYEIMTRVSQRVKRVYYQE